MMGMIQSGEDKKLMTIALDCVRILAFKDKATKAAVLERNGPQVLVGILREKPADPGNRDNLILHTIRLLKGGELIGF